MMMVIMSMLFSFGILYFKLQKFFFIIFLIFMLMVIKFNIYEDLVSEVSYIFCLEFYTIYLMLLSLWIIGLIFLIKMSNMMKLLIFFLLLILLIGFMTFNFLLYYIMFESSLLPIFFLLKFNSLSYERFEAMLYMMFFTLFSSVPFFILILMFYLDEYSLMYMYMMNLNIKLNWILLMMILMVFLVKMPMFFLHIWLPKAHVEATVYGSMILAGILLKLGGYGILRLMQFFFISMNNYKNYYIVISMIGSIILSLSCLIQIDMKMLVAYSSVVHMSMVISSLFTMSKIGFIGSYLMMIGHGVCSSGLFYILNLSYKNSNSRLLNLNKGFLNLYPSLSLFWFLLCIGNFSAPISLNLMAEIFMLMSLISLDYFFMIFLIMMCFFSAVYSMYLFSYSQHGNLNFNLLKFKLVSVMDYLIIIIHVMFLNFLIFFLNLFMI